MKILWCIWLWHPNYKGAEFIGENFNGIMHENFDLFFGEVSKFLKRKQD